MPPIEVRPASLTPHARRILAIFAQGGEWLTRRRIAEALGKSRLTQWEIALLDWLVDHEHVEVRKVAGPGRTGYQWQYRAKG